MGVATEALVVALGAVGTTPMWKTAMERVVATTFACALVLFAMSWIDFIPRNYAWITPLGVALVRLVSLGMPLPLEQTPERVLQFRPNSLVPRFWLALRIVGYVTVPSLVFTLIWPVAEPGTFWYAAIISTVAGIITLPVEFVLLALGLGENITASQRLSEYAELSVLAAESEEGDGAIDESTVSAEDLDAQLAYRYQRAREEAEAEVRRYVPTNPRTAKRMVNHVSLAMTIAEQRGLFRDSALTQQHLGKWIGISEQWPALGSALTTTPERMADLEQAISLAELQEILNELAPGTTASDEMRRRLQEGVPLGRLLAKLVRFDPT